MLQIDAFPKVFFHDRRINKDRAFAETVYNPGAIPLVWRGGRGSFVPIADIRNAGEGAAHTASQAD